MKLSIKVTFFWLFSLCAQADEERIYQTDSIGNIQYTKSSHTIQENGRIIVTDPISNKQYDKQQYQIKGDKVYQTD
ncbi:MAG: hypothetical protein Q7U98_10135 [Methylicorpusculum sp.]|uniref:hypothetical protein n=1 Tax=Methylicorpusculum sp. TaxID=2713644 RepID=UPI0027199445|nr:hypothetical protein [Methylicorpusculum sp.]MDO8939509.1 hypothetical protein [Methylicorpusculum sp.]MDP2178849.1 hypothetical protein [Methylicorpusculum sp.]MDP3529080.1 hypothetical protein [Methylicorpusculum sp.]